MISQLPDPLICHILSHLSTEEAVTTSVLSTRWRHLWLWLPCLDLNSKKFGDCNDFVRFGDRFFDSSRDYSCLHKLKLTLGNNTTRVDDDSYFTSWIDAAIKRKIQHLDIRWSTDVYLHENALRLYSCETLLYLRLYGVVLNDAVFVVLPCLKKMYLDKNWYPSEATLERLVSSCPVLEKLKIVASDNDTKVYRVYCQSLKRLTIERTSLLGVFYSDPRPGVVIDAPLLSCLTIDDHESKSFFVNNLESSAKLDISLCFGLREHGVRTRVSSRRSSIRDFLCGISRVGDITICPLTSKLLCRYSELEPLPRFGYMSRLCISLHAPSLKWLATFLESCPNLKSFSLEQFGFDSYGEEMTQSSVSFVPECLLSSLEFVDFKEPIVELGAEMNIVNYLLEHSAVLKKLTLRLDHRTKDEILKTFFQTPRGSTKCEVFIL